MQKKLLIVLIAAAVSLAGCDAFLSADARVSRADQRISANDYRGAMIELKNALQNEPEHVAARVKLAEVALHLGDAVAAEKDLRRAIEAGADPGATTELMVRVRLALGQFKDLLVQIDSGELAPEEPARSIYRGQALLGLQQFEPALIAFQSAANADSGSIAARVGIAEALMGQGKSDVALASLDELVADRPVPEAWLLRGAIRAKRGEFQLAQQDLQEAKQRADSTLSASQYMNLLAVLSEVQLARGETDAAAGTQAELAKIAPEAATTRVLAARIAMSKQDYATAIAELQRTVATAPDFVISRFLLGAALLAQGNLQQAEQHLTQTLQRAPENLEARKLLAQVHLRLGRPEAAMQVLLPVQQASNDVQLDLLLGLAHLQQGDESAGIAHLERAAAAQPDNINLRLDLATAYLKAGQGDKAVDLLSKMNRSGDIRQTSLLIAALADAKDVRAAQEVERLLDERPRDTAVLNLAAAFFARERQFDKARGVSQRALEIEPANLSTTLTRARIEVAAGDFDAAKLWLEKAVNLDATSAVARMGLAELAMQRGNASAAIATLEELRKRDPQAIDARLRLTALYFQQRNSQAAAAVVSELTVLGKQRPEVLNSLGTLFLDARRYDEALSRFQAATALDSANPVYWLNTARAQISLGNNSVGRETLEKALLLQPDWIAAAGALAMLDVKEKKGEAALARIAQLKTARPQDAAVLTLQGDVLMALRDFGKAAAAYDSAATAKASSTIAVKAYRARQLGQLPDPFQPLEAWIARQPADMSVRVALAEAYQRTGQAGDKRRAAAQYEAIERNGSASAIVLNNLAWLYHEIGDPRAEQIAKRAYDSAPGVAAVADTYGWILVQAGKPQQALGLLKQAAEAGNDPNIEYHYAVALAHSGAAHEGRGRLAELLSRSTDFEGAADARKLLESLTERLSLPQ